jgi:DNA invertase Pin-like site-specific DNA recombinase
MSGKKTKATKTAATIRRAAIYVRVSSERQSKTKGSDGKDAEEKESPQAQERDCQALAERQGYAVVKVYRDIEKYLVGKRMVEPSGTRADRPGLRQMLADARKGNFDVILAWREDRLYRGYRPMLDVLDCLEETGVTVELAKEHFDQNLAPVKAWAARMELQAKQERTDMGIKGRLASGKLWRLNPPYGYDLVDGELVENKTEASWLVQIWRWFGDNESMGNIRQWLLESQAPQKLDGQYQYKRGWHVSTIRNLLKHDYYHTGVYTMTWDGQTFEFPVPILIDVRIADKVKARRARFKAYPAGNYKAPSLVGGVLYCKACNLRMRVVTLKENGKVYFYYRCNNCARRIMVDGCARNVPLSKIDTEVWRKVWEELSDPVKWEQRIRAALAEKQAQEVDAEAGCKELEKKLDTLAFERQKVVTWARKELISEEDMGTQLAALTFEEAGLKCELSEKQLLVGNRAERFIEAMQIYRNRLVAGVQVNLDPQTPEERQALFEWQRKVVQGTVKRVDVKPDKTTEVELEFDERMLEVEEADLCISDTSAWLPRQTGSPSLRKPLPRPPGRPTK